MSTLQTAFPLPTHWTPDEALAAFEFLDALRDHLWQHYGLDIQNALQQQLASEHDPRQLYLDIDPQPF